MKKFNFVILILLLGLMICSTLQAESTGIANFGTKNSAKLPGIDL